MDLTHHEKKILDLIKAHPEIVKDTKARARIAKKHDLSEKTLRNRIGELKRRGLLEGGIKTEIRTASEQQFKNVDVDNAFDPVRKFKKLFFTIWFGITITAGIVSFFLPKWYSATAVILPPGEENSRFSDIGLGALLGSAGIDVFSNASSGQSRFLAILKSDRLMFTLIRKFDLRNKYEVDDLESALEILRKKFSLLVEDENQIFVTILDKDQDAVSEMTNEAVRILDSLNIVLSNTQARSSREFIETRVNEVLDTLKIFEKKLTDFMKREGILSLGDQVTVGVERAAEMKAIISAKEIELYVAEKMMDRNQPIIKQLRHELNQYKKNYERFFKSDTSHQLLPSFLDVPELGAELTRLQRGIEYHVKLLEFLGPQYEQAKINEAKDIPTLQVLDWAVRPEKKARPRRLLIIIGGFLLGILAGYFSVYVKNVIGIPRA